MAVAATVRFNARAILSTPVFFLARPFELVNLSCSPFTPCRFLLSLLGHFRSNFQEWPSSTSSRFRKLRAPTPRLWMHVNPSLHLGPRLSKFR
jgi:hypothetical protein